jgi:hypothetical protein
MSGNLHPVFVEALRGIAPPPATTIEQRKAHYRALLKRHDWSHEFSDDMRWVQRGRAERKELLDEQRELDPDFATWNALCHPWCKSGAAFPAYPLV